MKNMAKRITALVITILLAFPTGLGLSEEQAMSLAAGTASSDEAINSLNEVSAADTESDDSEYEVFSDAVDPEVGETNDMELGGEDGGTSDDDGAVTTYWFLVNDELFSEQAVGDGEAIQRPEHPEVPEGMAFSGWFLEDGTQLFAEGEEIAHVDEKHPFVNVIARFEDASTQDLSSDEEAVPGDSPVDTGEKDALVDSENKDIPVDAEEKDAATDVDTTGETTANTIEDDAENANDSATTPEGEGEEGGEDAGDTASNNEGTDVPNGDQAENGVENTAETNEIDASDGDQSADGTDSDKTEENKTFDDEQGETGETSDEEQGEEGEPLIRHRAKTPLMNRRMGRKSSPSV